MNIIEQIKALFSKKTWSSSDANVSAQKILLGDANAEPSGTIGMNDLASVLGGIVATGAPDDLNIIDKTSVFRTEIKTQNCPITGIVIVFKSVSNYVLQVLFSSATKAVYYRVRWDEGWREWRQIV